VTNRPPSVTSLATAHIYALHAMWAKSTLLGRFLNELMPLTSRRLDATAPKATEADKTTQVAIDKPLV